MKEEPKSLEKGVAGVKDFAKQIWDSLSYFKLASTAEKDRLN